MDGQDAHDRLRAQIERLLAFPGVGPLAAEAIAANLVVPAGSLDVVLVALVQEGRLSRMADGRFMLAVSGSER